MKTILKSAAIAVVLAGGAHSLDSRLVPLYDCAKYGFAGGVTAVSSYQLYTRAWASTGDHISSTHYWTSSLVIGTMGVVGGVSCYLLRTAGQTVVNMVYGINGK